MIFGSMRRVVLAFVFSGVGVFVQLPQQLLALEFETARNFEMGLALAMIPAEIVANKMDEGESPKIAAALHLLVDSLSIANKAFFFHNNIVAQENRQGEYSFCSRDMLVNGALAVLDVKDFFKHLSKIIPVLPKTEADDDIDFYVPEFDEEELNEITGSQEITQLFRVWRIVVLPCMRGLTAFALASTQQCATAYATPEARNLATAAHSFVRLLTEHAALDVDPNYKKILYVALAVNAVWLVKEIQNYHQSLPSPMERVQGDCPICMEANIELVRLHCGHTQCMGCLREQIDVAFANRGVEAFNKVPCSAHHNGCQEHLNRAEIAEATNNRYDAVRAYEEAGFLRNHKGTMSDEDVRRQGFKRCPNPECRVPIQKGEACRHVVCTQCHHQFCWWCLGDNYDYQHEQNECQNHGYGQDPHNQDQNWDYQRESLTVRPPVRPRPRVWWM